MSVIAELIVEDAESTGGRTERRWYQIPTLVAGLTIVPSTRKLYAATHGLAAWSLKLP